MKLLDDEEMDLGKVINKKSKFVDSQQKLKLIAQQNLELQA